MKTLRLPPLLPCLVALAVASALPAAGQGYPTPTGERVSDYAGVLQAEHADSLRSLLEGLRADGGIDARVVTIRSRSSYRTGDASLQQFANRLMDAWEVGDAQRKDGALVVLAVDDREVWVALGARYGADFDTRVQDIVSGSMIPYFRQGDYGGGVVSGTTQLAYVLGSGSSAFSEAPATGAGGYSGSPGAAPAPQPAYSEPAYVPDSSPRSYGGGGPSGTTVAVVGAIAGLLGLGYLGSRPRKCADCGQPMTRLEEHADDVFLESGQKLEEKLGSVNYDVWKCAACNTHTVLPRRSLFSGVKDCPSCKYRTVQVERRVLERPTYTSTGREQVDKDCRNCGWHDTDVVVLPRRTPPSDSSSSSSSWRSSSSSSRSSSSSSSSSSSRSSGGGGSRSSGGGAGGKW